MDKTSTQTRLKQVVSGKKIQVADVHTGFWLQFHWNYHLNNNAFPLLFIDVLDNLLTN